jgi:hypothetical protein
MNNYNHYDIMDGLIEGTVGKVICFTKKQALPTATYDKKEIVLEADGSIIVLNYKNDNLLKVNRNCKPWYIMTVLKNNDILKVEWAKPKEVDKSEDIEVIFKIATKVASNSKSEEKELGRSIIKLIENFYK